MPLSSIRVRRATLDDIAQLMPLWKSMGFSVDDLAKRVTEFQVAEQAGDALVGAIGLQLADRQGCIHSEAFPDYGLADQIRPQFWERLQALATNHGLHRLWCQEQAPFWSHCGLVRAEGAELAKKPGAFAGGNGPWLTLKLREDVDAVLSADREFTLFIEGEKQRSARALQRARMLKVIATLIALGLVIAVAAGILILVRNNPGLLRR